MIDSRILVSSPLLPPLDEFKKMLEDIWSKQWLTNNGFYHKEFEKALIAYLGVPHISVFTNGTLPLITVLQALNITGEVITTPYSFIATANSLHWNNITPVFVDVDAETGNIDPNKIEAAITSKTTAIMPVHVYGVPCEVDKIQSIANKYNLKVIYDAAHAFGVEINGQSILNAGNASTLSFHATKVFNTAEGGGVVCHDEETKTRINCLRNFGFIDEKTLIGIGMNSKMDEIRCAYGLLNLKQVDVAIEVRKSIAEYYINALKNIKGLKIFNNKLPNVKYNYSYFPIFITESEYGMSRDDLYERMIASGIIARKYFYPLISDFSVFKDLESARVDNLPIATELASTVICLPIHTSLSEKDVDKVISCIIENNG